MPNRLADETSPYLRQHADNPVDWWPWCDEAFELARRTDRPVLLSVGYSSCHWCHVMAHESFEDPSVAALMNDWFVPIKVDREERPDVDAVYMEATQSMTGHGGWPMTVFADADGRPFFCGTYFPPAPQHGRAGFPQLLEAVHDAWTNRRDELSAQAERLTDALRRPIGSTEGRSGPDAAARPGTTELDEATMGLLAAYDGEWGGFGRAPKFPQAMSLGHLLRQHHRTGSATAIAAVVASLDAMAAGGIHDHLGGGFSRYSVDRRWLVPHFEKMLYDNALLLRLYTHAHLVTGEQRFGDVAASIVDYVQRDLSHPGGGRYSAEDADSLRAGAAPGAHPEEGAFYTWTPDQVAAALDAAGLGEHADAACEWYGITADGNFEGASIPNRLHARSDPSPESTPLPPGIEAARAALLVARAARPRPGLDDKVLTEWNALFVAALAEAGAGAGNEEWVAEAERTAEFLLRELRRDDGRWLRSWQADGSADPGDAGPPTGRARHLAYSADLGALLDAFVCLHEATGRRRWIHEAVTVAEQLDELFIAAASHQTDGTATDGTVFSTGSDAEALLVRPREVMDNATPSGASLAAVGFLRLGALTGDERWVELGRRVIGPLGGLVGAHPMSFGHLLWAVQLDAVGITEVVVTGDRPDLVEAIQRRFHPSVVLTWGEAGGPLWEGRTETGDDGRAYVCRDRTCDAPINDPADLPALP